MLTEPLTRRELYFLWRLLHTHKCWSDANRKQQNGPPLSLDTVIEEVVSSFPFPILPEDVELCREMFNPFDS